jgi:hypothetical protein
MTSEAPQLPKSLAESIENSKAEYRKLGKSGLRDSVPIFRAMSIGHKDWIPWLAEEQGRYLCLKLRTTEG